MAADDAEWVTECLQGQEAKIMWHTRPATPTSPDAIKHPTEWIAARVLSALIGVQSPHASIYCYASLSRSFLTRREGILQCRHLTI